MKLCNSIFLFALSIFCLTGISFADTTSVGAATYPKQNRGFYNSFDIGISYIDYKTRDDGAYDYGEVSYKGGGFPLMEFRFGTGLANLVAFYTQFNFSIHIGTSDEKDFNCDGYDECSIDEDESSSETTALMRTYVGFGFSLYPFRDTSSVMNGFFFGGSSGYSVESMLGPESSIDFAFTVEMGKEWWVSERFSLGFSVAYFHAFPQFEVKRADSSIGGFQLLFRMTRG